MSESSSQPKKKMTPEELEKEYRRALKEHPDWLFIGRWPKLAQGSVPEIKAPSSAPAKPSSEIPAGPEVKAVPAALLSAKEEGARKFDQARQRNISMHPSGSALQHSDDMNVTEIELEGFIRKVVSKIDCRKVSINGSDFSIKLGYAVDNFGGGLDIVVSSTLTYKSIAGTFSSRGVVVHHAY